MNIYISNLDTNLTDNDLLNLFKPFGLVQSASIAIDVFTDQSRGFGYVEMPDQHEANSAITALNQSEFNGRVIAVSEAEIKEVHRGSYKVGNPTVKGYQFRKN